jgi:putative FmdB family regulatory protein
VPTYHYRCPSCSHEFERFHKMSVKAAPKCPKCGRRTERVISGGAGLVFKGSGFYITDYKRAGAAKSGEAGAGAKAEKADKAEKTEKAEKAEKAEESARAGTRSVQDKPGKPTKSSGAES